MFKILFILFFVIIIYLIYRLTTISSFKKKNLIFVNIIAISSILFFLILFFYLNETNIESLYVPPKFDGEKVIPGYFSEIK